MHSPDVKKINTNNKNVGNNFITLRQKKFLIKHQEFIYIIKGTNFLLKSQV
ncbi:hypothetical protein AQPE_3497 [Aquipluma nitroreducens]|uniref:Uncharacterized protein n=1 Tax=Aquipluma nitroreducens TaxID=2010828 RepID=A0A5K7SCJ1_9BACT|nr:hypothetical protein AQPE_3497 [Aquipluma nitroreducens]